MIGLTSCRYFPGCVEQCQVTADPQTQPTTLSCESTCRLLQETWSLTLNVICKWSTCSEDSTDPHFDSRQSAIMLLCKIVNTDSLQLPLAQLLHQLTSFLCHHTLCGISKVLHREHLTKNTKSTHCYLGSKRWQYCGGLVVGRPTAVQEDPGSNLTAAGCVYHDSHSNMQPWARVVHPYCSA